MDIVRWKPEAIAGFAQFWQVLIIRRRRKWMENGVLRSSEERGVLRSAEESATKVSAIQSFHMEGKRNLRVWDLERTDRCTMWQEDTSL